MKQKAVRGLKYLERYTKTDMVYLASGGFWLTSGRFIAMVIGLLSSIAFANLLDPTTYGTYTYVLGLFSAISLFSMSGLSSSLLQAASRKERGALRESFRYYLTWSGGLVLISFVIGAYYLWQGDVRIGGAFLLNGIISPFIFAGNLCLPFLNGIRAYKLTAQRAVVGALFQTTVMIAALFLSSNLLFLIAAYLLSSVLVAIFYYIKTIAHFDQGILSSAQKIRLRSYAKHLSVMQVIGSASTHLDKILIFQFLGAAELALYAFATLIPTQIKSLLKNVYDLLLPKYATQTYKSISSSIAHKTLLLSIMIIATVCIYYFIAPPIYHLLFPQYTDAISLSQVYALTLLGMLTIFPNAALTTQEAKRELYTYNIITTITRPTILFVGIYWGGLWGAIAAQIITNLIQIVLFYLLLWYAIVQDHISSENETTKLSNSV